jgi:hypothetical protein
MCTYIYIHKEYVSLMIQILHVYKNKKNPEVAQSKRKNEEHVNLKNKQMRMNR